MASRKSVFRRVRGTAVAIIPLVGAVGTGRTLVSLIMGELQTVLEAGTATTSDLELLNDTPARRRPAVNDGAPVARYPFGAVSGDYTARGPTLRAGPVRCPQ